MANNRMFLIHKPTNERILLAKNLGAEWYAEKGIEDKLNYFFDLTYEDDEVGYVTEYEDNDNTWNKYGVYVYYKELENVYDAIKTLFSLSKEHNYGLDKWIEKVLKDLENYINTKKEDD